MCLSTVFCHCDCHVKREKNEQSHDQTVQRIGNENEWAAYIVYLYRNPPENCWNAMVMSKVCSLLIWYFWFVAWEAIEHGHGHFLLLIQGMQSGTRFHSNSVSSQLWNEECCQRIRWVFSLPLYRLSFSLPLSIIYPWTFFGIFRNKSSECSHDHRTS